MDIFQLMGRITIDSSGAKKSIDETSKGMVALKDKFASGLKTVSKWGVGVTAAVTGAAAATYAYVKRQANAFDSLTKQQAMSLDYIDKQSQKTGMTRQAFQEWDFIMSQNGASVETLKNGIRSLTSAMDSAASGGKDQIATFHKLGVRVTDTKGKLRSSEEVMMEVIRALQKMPNETERARLAVELFGEAGTELLPLLNAGAGSIEELRKQAKELGIIIGDDAVDAGVKFSDATDKMNRAVKAIGMNIAGKILPLFTKATDWFTGFVTRKAPGLYKAFDSMVSGFKSLASVKIDIDGNGSISAAEFGSYVRRIVGGGIDWMKQKITLVLDEDGNGAVTADDFGRWVKRIVSGGADFLTQLLGIQKDENGSVTPESFFQWVTSIAAGAGSRLVQFLGIRKDENGSVTPESFFQWVTGIVSGAGSWLVQKLGITKDESGSVTPQSFFKWVMSIVAGAGSSLVQTLGIKISGDPEKDGASFRSLVDRIVKPASDLLTQVLKIEFEDEATINEKLRVMWEGTDGNGGIKGAAKNIGQFTIGFIDPEGKARQSISDWWNGEGEFASNGSMYDAFNESFKFVFGVDMSQAEKDIGDWWEKQKQSGWYKFFADLFGPKERGDSWTYLPDLLIWVNDKNNEISYEQPEGTTLSDDGLRAFVQQIEETGATIEVDAMIAPDAAQTMQDGINGIRLSVPVDPIITEIGSYGSYSRHNGAGSGVSNLSRSSLSAFAQHATGLDFVPRDGYIASLHQGETVLTRAEADAWRAGRAGYGGGVDNSRMDTLIGLMQQLVQANSRDIVLDSGALVGQLGGRLDASMGRIAARKGRGN